MARGAERTCGDPPGDDLDVLLGSRSEAAANGLSHPRSDSMQPLQQPDPKEDGPFLHQLDQWSAAHRSVDLNSVQGGYHSAELWFEEEPPALSLTRRREAVRRLVEIHDRWLDHCAEIESDRYLGIWIFEPYLSESQVVFGVGERALFYQTRHASGAAVSPPPDYHTHPCDLARFDWMRHEWTADIGGAEAMPDDDGRRALWCGQLHLR